MPTQLVTHCPNQWIERGVRPIQWFNTVAKKHTMQYNLSVDYYKWDSEKNERLRAERGVSFEQIVMHIERGDVLGVYDHPNPFKYPNQRVLVVQAGNYAYLVPFVDSNEGRFLKTIIPSRKATRDFLGGLDEED